MTTLYSTAFTATETPPTNWTLVNGINWSANAGSLQGDEAGGQFFNIRTTTTLHAAVADCQVSVTRVSGTSFDGGVMVRASGSSGAETCYYMDVYSTSTIDIIRRVAGTDTTLSTRTVTHADGDIYKLYVSGTGATVTLKLFRNGSQLGADIADTSGSRITAAGQTGIIMWAGGSQRFDDFLVEDLGSGGATTTKTMTDTLVTSDAALDPTYRVRLMSDTSVLSDAEIDYLRLVRQSSDALVVTDSFIDYVRYVRRTDEPLTVIDGVIKQLAGSGLVVTKVMSEGLVLADGTISIRNLVRTQSDNISTVSEGGTYRQLVVTASETLDLVDETVKVLRFKRVAEDALSLIDAFSKAVGSAGGLTYAKVMSDSVTLIDTAGQRWTMRTTRLTDSVALTEGAVRALARIRIHGETIELTDGTLSIRRTVRIAQDSLDVPDELIRSIVFDQLYTTNFRLSAGANPFRFGIGSLPFD